MRFNKFAKSVLAFGLATISTFSVVGCGESSSQSSAKISDVEIWSTYATETVWRDVGEYDSVKFPAEVSLKAIRGETESAQIIISTGDKAVSSYDVSITDLQCGQEKFVKENIKIYSEIYINVAATEYYAYNGYCADGLAPFEGVKALGENTIDANSNQGILISFKIPESQAPGTYNGTLKITIGGEDKTIPVSLTVANASIGVENHSKSSFSVMWGHARGELDSTESMMNKYIETLSEYRIGPNIIMYRTNDSAKEINLYAKKACEFAKNPKIPSYGTPYDSIKVKNFEIEYSGEIEIEEDGVIKKVPDKKIIGNGVDDVEIYDGEQLYKYFMAYFYEGLKQGVDPFKKAFIKGIDEPFFHHKEALVLTGAYIIKQTKERAIKDISADTSVNIPENEAILNQMIESLRAVPHIVTDKEIPIFYDENAASNPSLCYDPKVMDLTLCPYFDKLTSKSQIEKFRLFEGNELWWYGCNVPTQPYPTYHLGDTLLSPRIVGWMQAEYNIVGNLYWGCDFSKGINDDGSNWLEDYYDGGMRTNNTYGEGFLIYPGKKYGVDGPIASLRLEAIRDGLEEFEMIYEIQKLYQERGYTADEILNVIYDTLYRGSSIPRTINGEIFSNARERLIDLLVLAQSDANIMIKSFKEERDKQTYEVFAKDGYELKLGKGFSITSEKDEAGGKLYTVSTKIGNAKTFDIKTEVNNVEYGVSFDLFSKMQFHYADSFIDQIVKDTHENAVELTKESVAGKTVDANEEDGINYVQLSLGDSATDGEDENGDKITGREQRVLIKGSLISGITQNTGKIVFEIWSDLDEEIPLTIYYKGTKSTHRVTPIDSAVPLVKGQNKITFDVPSNIWNNIGGKFDYFMLSFGEKGDAARTGIYLVGMSVYDK